jgi:hypothetical protein
MGGKAGRKELLGWLRWVIAELIPSCRYVLLGYPMYRNAERRISVAYLDERKLSERLNSVQALPGVDAAACLCYGEYTASELAVTGR